MRLLVFCLVLGAALAAARYQSPVKESQQAGLQCKDEEGNDVDWYVVYKFPETSGSHVKILSGAGYMYITSKTAEKGWTVSEKTMQDDTNIMAKTLASMYEDKSEEMWLVYNDESPAKLDLVGYDEHGHTKGVVGGDVNGGIWLIHSIPKFPSLESYVYPKTALRYGQSAMCISLPASELDKIGVAFKYNEPDFEKKKIGDLLGATYPNLKDAAAGGTVKSAPWYHQFTLTSRGGVKFSGFAKSKNFGKDLYEWVASSMQTDLYAETWLNEPKPLPASCTTTWKVMNVKEIAYKAAKVDFSSHKDHSKWAISASSKKPIVCSGDINRAVPQERRGGGTLCISNDHLWSAYNQLIYDKDSCNKKL